MKLVIVDYGMGNILSIVGALKHLGVTDIAISSDYELVLNIGKPILGICLGMQIMGKKGSENGINLGLGFVNSETNLFENPSIKVPHVGFNQVKKNTHSRLYDGFLENNIDFYFTHSYKMTSNDNINQSYCHYGKDFIASFEHNNIAGVQFHPELSQNNGLKLLKNFVTLF
jgi:glutamine amidotransferase